MRVGRFFAPDLPVFVFAPLLALALASLAQTPGPASRFDAWTIIGPGGGGTTIGPTISPFDPNLVVERCDMTGDYITHDGGRSWRMFNLRAAITAFAFDPANPRRIYAGGSALWRSDDSGRSWRMVFPNPSENTVEHQNGDHADYTLTSRDALYVTGLKILQITVDPRSAKIVHLAFSDPRRGGTTLLFSTNRGRSFRFERHFPGDQILLLLYPGGHRVAIGTEGVYRGEANSAAPIAGPGDRIAHASAGEAQGRTIFYATTQDGALFVSEDGGRTWESRTPRLGQQSGSFGAVAAAGGDGRVAYLGFRGLKLGKGDQNLWNGIAKTVDAGRNWSIVFRESTRPAVNLASSWIEERIEERAIGSGTDQRANIFFDAPYSLAVAPGDPAICYATDLFRTYRTFDGGQTWAQADSVRTADDHWTTRGLDVTTDYGVQFDPFDSQHAFIDYTDIGAFASQDGGHSWTSATRGIPDAWRNTTYWLAFDPQVKGLIWGAFSGIHDLPRPKMWRRGGFLQRARGGIAVSTDGGQSWTPSNRGMKEAAFTYVLLDPLSPVGQRTLYACGFGVGVYKSTDNGKTWQLKNSGITEKDPFAWRITRGSDGTLYLIVARANEGRSGTKTGSGALYKSIDGAEHWTRINLPAGVNGPTGIELDPRDNRRVYLTAWEQERPGVDSGGGVFLSTNGGQSWKPLFSRSEHVYDLTIAPHAPDTLYICGFDAAAYRSTDAGLHWKRIRGYNFKWGHRVVIDPVDPSMIYITTYGGGVWHGPAAGDPRALEDSRTHVPVAH